MWSQSRTDFSGISSLLVAHKDLRCFQTLCWGGKVIVDWYTLNASLPSDLPSKHLLLYFLYAVIASSFFTNTTSATPGCTSRARFRAPHTQNNSWGQRAGHDHSHITALQPKDTKRERLHFLIAPPILLSKHVAESWHLSRHVCYGGVLGISNAGCTSRNAQGQNSILCVIHEDQAHSQSAENGSI